MTLADTRRGARELDVTDAEAEQFLAEISHVGDATTRATVNAEVLCIPMIETLEGVAATGGVAALIIGPYDMSLSMHLPLGSDEVDLSIERILAAGQAAGAPVSRHFDTGRAAREGFARGFLFVTVGTDREWLATAAVEAATASRPEGTPPPGAGHQLPARAVATSARA